MLRAFFPESLVCIGQLLHPDTIHQSITSTGGHVLLDVSGVTVFVEGGADNIFYKTGDRIRVTGIVETYGSSKEISVGPSGSILIIE